MNLIQMQMCVLILYPPAHVRGNLIINERVMQLRNRCTVGLAFTLSHLPSFIGCEKLRKHI